jgi:hypothetical protein
VLRRIRTFAGAVGSPLCHAGLVETALGAAAAAAKARAGFGDGQGFGQGVDVDVGLVGAGLAGCGDGARRSSACWRGSSAIDLVQNIRQVTNTSSSTGSSVQPPATLLFDVINT